MKFLFILMGSGLLLLLRDRAVWAENPDHVRQLLQTNTCENCDLSGVNLSNFDLEGANLQGANLQNSILSHSQMSRANLSSANLQGAILSAADLRGANLQNAQLTGMTITNFCRLSSYNYPMQNEECQIMRMLSALGSEICRDEYGLWAISEFQETMDQFCGREDDHPFFLIDVRYGSGRSSPFLPIRLTGANLREANLSGLDLDSADLRYADLSGADLSNANLAMTLLIDAELDGVSGANLDQAILNKSDVADRVSSLLEPQRQQAIESEARSYVGSMNRAQQAYYLERGEFSDTVDALGLGIASETEYYRYDIMQVSAIGVMQMAIPKAEGHTSYLGIVAVFANASEQITQARLCTATEPLSDRLDLPPIASLVDETISCPAGFEPFIQAVPRQVPLRRRENRRLQMR
ncbi:MAG: pentapeptide repeat-containing protein [Elainellaceae cyanobacterium]